MLPKSVQNLIDEFSRLPGVGPKSAARLTFYLLTKPSRDIENLGNSVLNLSKNLRLCSICFNISENDICSICTDEKRNHRIVAVVSFVILPHRTQAGWKLFNSLSILGVHMSL